MTWQGSVVSVNIVPGSPGDGNKPASVAEANAVAGKGLEGDRYFDKNPDGQVTLIEAEAIEALEREAKVKIDPSEARRNIVTRGVPLNHLVGRDFSVGGVRVHGVRLNEPCSHLASLTEEKVREGLVHRGGLRARILNDGTVHVGDEVRPG